MKEESLQKCKGFFFYKKIQKNLNFIKKSVDILFCVCYNKHKKKPKGGSPERSKAMKIDKEHFENEVWEYGKMEGQKYYHFEKVDENIGAYCGEWADWFFEIDTLEVIGIVRESDVRATRKDYYTANYYLGWDGKKATRKEKTKTLCTRGDYSTARHLLLNEYKNR